MFSENKDWDTFTIPNVDFRMGFEFFYQDFGYLASYTGRYDY